MKAVVSLQTICFSLILFHWEHIPKQSIKRLPKDLLTILVDKFVSERELSFHVLKWLEGTEFQTLNLSSQAGRVSNDWLSVVSTFQLEKLELNFCKNLTDEGLYRLVSCPGDLQRDFPLTCSLQQLDLSGCCQLSNEGMGALSCFSALETLVLDYCSSLGNTSLSYILQVPGLKSLSIASCDKISGRGLEQLFGLQRLEFLNLSSCSRITSDALSHIGRLKNLKHLKLRNCFRIDNRALEHIGSLTCLETLELYDCVKIDDNGLKFLEKCTQMRFLCLSGTCITANGIASLAEVFMPHLESLHLTRCYNLVGTPLSFALRKLSKSLKHLNLRYLYCVDEEVLRAITETCPHMESLNLTDCRYLTDKAVSLLENFSSLFVLKLGGTSISDDGIFRLTKVLQKISELDISSCISLSEKVIRHIVNNGESLAVLDISRNPLLTNKPWNLVGRPSLKRLSLKTLVIEQGGTLGRGFLTSIAHLFPQLETLLLSKCCIDSDDFRAFVDLSNLKHLKLFSCEVPKPIEHDFLRPLKKTLQHLNLSNCKFVNDDLCAVIGEFVHLESLNLKNCREVTVRGLLSLYPLSHLSYLNLRGCLLSQEAIWLLERNLSGISVLKYDMTDCTGFHSITLGLQQHYHSGLATTSDFDISENLLEPRNNLTQPTCQPVGSPVTRKDISKFSDTIDGDYKNVPKSAGSFHRRRRKSRIEDSPPFSGKRDSHSKLFLYMDSIQLLGKFANHP